jgi:hypothetical protein
MLHLFNLAQPHAVFGQLFQDGGSAIDVIA